MTDPINIHISANCESSFRGFKRNAVNHTTGITESAMRKSTVLKNADDTEKFPLMAQGFNEHEDVPLLSIKENVKKLDSTIEKKSLRTYSRVPKLNQNKDTSPITHSQQSANNVSFVPSRAPNCKCIDRSNFSFLSFFQSVKSSSIILAAEVRFATLKAKENAMPNSMFQADMLISPTDAATVKDTDFFSNDHLNGFTVLLRRYARMKNELIGGLNNLDGSPTLLMEKVDSGRKWVQLLHDGAREGGHWAVAAYGFKFIEKGAIALYDSANYKVWRGPTKHMQTVIASMMRPEQQNITLMLMPSSKKSNGYDCGPYALAFATVFVLGHDPSQLEFNAGKIRKHAMQCLITGEISSFPTKKLKLKHDREPITYKFPVYCVC